MTAATATAAAASSPTPGPDPKYLVALVVAVAVAAVIAWLGHRSGRSSPGSTQSAAAASPTSTRLLGQQWSATVTRMTDERASLPTAATTLNSPGGHRYRFVFVRFPDNRCRAYILPTPGLDLRGCPPLETHRLTDTRGRDYVCFEPEPRRPDHILAVAVLWMDGIDAYRRTGRFAATQPRRDPPWA